MKLCNVVRIIIIRDCLHFVQCYYIGASDIAATKLVNEITKPLSFGMPPEKICEKLKAKDGEICDLKYGE